MDYNEAGLERSLAAHRVADAAQIIDIRYQDLKQNPLSAIHQIQKTLTLRPSEAWTKSWHTHSNPPGKTTTKIHYYSAAQFGLLADQIRERFTEYLDNYDIATQ